MSTLADGTKKFGPAPNPEPIFVCGGDCGRMTRPSRMKLKNAPNTVSRASKTMCLVCDAKFAPPRHRTLKRPEPAEHKTQATMNSLDAFVAERNRRLASRMRQGGQ
jgi:hypothetical protein